MNKGKSHFILIYILLAAIFGLLIYNLLSRPSDSSKLSYKTDRDGIAQNRQIDKPVVNDGGASEIVLADINDNDHIRGPKDAPITIVEFSDSECPFCKSFHGTMQEVMKAYPEEVRWVYKHAPLDQLHSKARKEAQAIECAADQGGNEAFWAYLDRLFEVTPSNDGLSSSQLPEIAEYVGLDKSEFNDCLSSDKFKDRVQNDLEEAQTAGLRGTPYSVIVFGDTRLPINGAMSFSQLQTMIESLQ